MSDGFSLTSSLFAHYLLRGKQVPLVQNVENENDISTALTITLMGLANQDANSKPREDKLLRFRYKYNFWSDVTRISDGIIKNSQRWENRLREVGPKIGNVSGFCEVWSQILQSGTFTMDANVRFFREDCKPVYEQPPHVDGGKFQIFFDMDFENIDYVIPLDVIKCFLCLIIHMLCGQLGYEENIFGVTFHVRRQGIALSLWHRNSDCAEEKDFISRQLKDLFPTASHGYIVHKDQAQKFSMKLRDNERKRKQLARKRKSEKQSLEAQAAMGLPHTPSPRATTAPHAPSKLTSNHSNSLSTSLPSNSTTTDNAQTNQHQRHTFPRASPPRQDRRPSLPDPAAVPSNTKSTGNQSGQEDDLVSSESGESDGGWSGDSGGGSGSQSTSPDGVKQLYNASKLFSQHSSGNSWNREKNNHKNSHNRVEFGEFNLQESMNQDSDKKQINGIRITATAYPKSNTEVRDRRVSLPTSYRNNSNNSSNNSNNSNSNSASSSNGTKSSNTISNENRDKPTKRDSNSKISFQNPQQLNSSSQSQQKPLQQTLQQTQQQSDAKPTPLTANNTNFQRTLPLNELKLLNRRRIQSMPSSPEKQEQLQQKYQLDRDGASPLSPRQDQQEATELVQVSETIEQPLKQPREVDEATEPSGKNELPYVRHSYPKSVREQQLLQLEQEQILAHIQAHPKEKKPSPANESQSDGSLHGKHQQRIQNTTIPPRQKQQPQQLPQLMLPKSHSISEIMPSESPQKSGAFGNCTTSNDRNESRNNNNKTLDIGNTSNNNTQNADISSNSMEVTSGVDINSVPKLESAVLEKKCHGHGSAGSMEGVNEATATVAISDVGAKRKGSTPSTSERSLFETKANSTPSDSGSVQSEMKLSKSSPPNQPINATTKRKKFQNFQQPKREKLLEKHETSVCPQMTQTNFLISVLLLLISASIYWII